MSKLFVISGSSGVGKGTVIKEFLKKHPDYKLSVSCTTRPVTQTAEVEVNSAYIKEAPSLSCVETGSISSRLPARITSINPIMII